MRNRLYGGVRGRKMKVGGNYFIFLLLDYLKSYYSAAIHIHYISLIILSLASSILLASIDFR